MKNKWNRTFVEESRAAHPRFYKELRMLRLNNANAGEITDAQYQLAIVRQSAKRHR